MLFLPGYLIVNGEGKLISMNPKKIGKFIADRRKDNGWTQNQLAEKLGVTDKAVSKWENGKSMPDVSLFLPLCELLQMTLNEFLLGEFISDGDLKTKSNQVLYEVITSWLGNDQWKEKDTVSHLEAVVKLTNVRKIYDKENASVAAVNNVSFEVMKGSFVGIMGASGSGKTTLLNLIATVDDFSDGIIEINGQDLAKLTERDMASFRREHLGFIFQEYNLLDTLTIYENIALALTVKQFPKKNIKKAVTDLADTMGLSDILYKFPYGVSGGQRQRCACARAIITNPDIILADEPTGSIRLV